MMAFGSLLSRTAARLFSRLDLRALLRFSTFCDILALILEYPEVLEEGKG